MKIHDKKLFKEGVFSLAVVLAVFVLVLATDAFSLKRHSAFLFNTVWMSCLSIKTIIISLSEEKSKKENMQRRLAKIARQNVFDKKEPLVHILWVGMMLGSMPAVLYSIKLAVALFFGGCGVLVWYIYVVEDEIKRIKKQEEFIIEE